MHTPVLLQEAIDGLHLKEGGTVLDATVGGGGHAEEICRAVGKRGMLIGLDRDTDQIARTQKRLLEGPCRIGLHEADFRDLDRVLDDLNIATVNAALFDLGWSSDQLENSGRGFSFHKDEPLLLTYKKDPSEEDLTAREIVNTWDEENIEAVLKGYGEEEFSRAIARTIVVLRKEKPFRTTEDLVEAVQKAVPRLYRHRRIHFATKTFQALRIAVNDEIEGLKEALGKAYERLAPRGRIVVVAFHGTEDRVVKNFFKRLSNEGKGSVITKKPIVPTAEEIERNPRSRSAKLRIFEK